MVIIRIQVVGAFRIQLSSEEEVWLRDEAKWLGTGSGRYM